jgi:uncharacterized protein
LDTLLILVILLAMFATLMLIVVSSVPVSALEWAIAMLFAALTGFQRVTPTAAILMTACMALGSTSQFWMPFFGMKGRQISCLGILAFFIGSVVGGILIPIPIIGSIIGGMVAVFLVEFARVREFRAAMRSGGAALKMMLYGMIVEFVCAAVIVAIFIVSVLTTGS